jgi:hypothetical protein
MQQQEQQEQQAQQAQEQLAAALDPRQDWPSEAQDQLDLEWKHFSSVWAAREGAPAAQPAAPPGLGGDDEEDDELLVLEGGAAWSKAGAGLEVLARQLGVGGGVGEDPEYLASVTRSRPGPGEGAAAPGGAGSRRVVPRVRLRRTVGREGRAGVGRRAVPGRRGSRPDGALVQMGMGVDVALGGGSGVELVGSLSDQELEGRAAAAAAL